MPDGPAPMTAIFSVNEILRWLSICMALADSVPGVSGGTIAFLMGFYDVTEQSRSGCAACAIC